MSKSKPLKNTKESYVCPGKDKGYDYEETDGK